MIRALLDTNVLVSAAIKPDGKPAQILQQAGARFELLCTEFVLAELADVLTRPHIQKKYLELVVPERREQFTALVCSLAELVDVQGELSVVSDADDNPVLAEAVEGEADYLVTGDPHLLAIGALQTCRMVTPDAFLQLLLSEV
jgi:putative PIN family toxin of toxin-antitoxin system